MSSKCPSCGNSNAQHLLTSFLCPNESCANFDKQLKDELTPKEKSYFSITLPTTEELVTPITFNDVTSGAVYVDFSGYNYAGYSDYSDIGYDGIYVSSGGGITLGTNTFSEGSYAITCRDFSVSVNGSVYQEGSSVYERLSRCETKITKLESTIENLVATIEKLNNHIKKNSR